MAPAPCLSHPDSPDGCEGGTTLRLRASATMPRTPSPKSVADGPTRGGRADPPDANTNDGRDDGESKRRRQQQPHHHYQQQEEKTMRPRSALPASPPEATYSSGVAFYPPSSKYWRIGGRWYDFAEFLPRHPGGAAVLELARDRFEDATFVFESHHLNYPRARKVIEKYEVSEEVVRREGLRRRPGSKEGEETPKLLDDDAFYSVVRRRVYEYLTSIGKPRGEPTLQCKIFFWTAFLMWSSNLAWLIHSGTILSAITCGLTSAWLGAFGHNWVHQPKYKLWANLSLDTIGFSSDTWLRDHNLQHHMYTNTAWDNHFKGTEPFLVTDPTVERRFLQKCMAYLNPFVLAFGMPGNYVAHTIELIKGNESFTPWKLLLPLEHAIMIRRWGFQGFALMFLSHAILGVYYFTLALMNHNAEHCLDATERNKCQDWGICQLGVCADWGVGMPFHAAWVYLWLNYHTVHHLFPLVDMSHHPAIQKILIETCREFDVKYVAGNPVEIYKQMVRSFASPAALMQEISVYNGF
ncbi:hypothetical protein ACHAWF_002033 [Thalassiosira exigua]